MAQPLPKTVKETLDIKYGGRTAALPIVRGSEGEIALDIARLRGQTGLITLDPGFANTGSCMSKITFINGEEHAIEAIYTFPLGERGAIDAMWIRTEDREIRGEIKRREEAREIYEDAKRAGQFAALLDQERPNIFTQAIANLMPGAEVEVVRAGSQSEIDRGLIDQHGDRRAGDDHGEQSPSKHDRSP